MFLQIGGIAPSPVPVLFPFEKITTQKAGADFLFHSTKPNPDRDSDTKK